VKIGYGWEDEKFMPFRVNPSRPTFLPL
jgi:hypothetical protein